MKTVQRRRRRHSLLPSNESNLCTRLLCCYRAIASACAVSNADCRAVPNYLKCCAASPLAARPSAAGDPVPCDMRVEARVTRYDSNRCDTRAASREPLVYERHVRVQPGAGTRSAALAARCLQTSGTRGGEGSVRAIFGRLQLRALSE